MAYKSNTERVSEIREKLKSEFPDYKFSIRKSNYNGINITILEAPINLLKGQTDKYVQVNNYYIDDHYKDYPEIRDVLKKINSIASEGVTWRETGDYGNQPDFYVYINIGSWDKPFKVIKSSKPSGNWNRPTKPQKEYDKGELLKECGGWKIYKKTLNDGRIVYNAIKDKETPPNKGDWNAIKGEVYVQSGFKWGKFGAFEKWGKMTPNDENLIFELLCSVLSKYYVKDEKPATIPQMPEEEESGDMVVKFQYILESPQGNLVTLTAYEYPTNKKMKFSLYLNDIKQKGFEDAGELDDYFYDLLKKYIATGYKLKLNESYKKIPANPKLDYCEIRNAEGMNLYSESFPIRFTSFTALTKFIADNIGELPKLGYDKHRVEWKWKFEDEVISDRWDVSSTEANPYRFPNLYASENIQNLCYYAWKKDGESEDESDYYYAEKVGKDGFEINNEQFLSIIYYFMSYYKQDKETFSYNTTEERLQRFKSVYPKLWALFTGEESTSSKKENIEKTIKALQYLADKGNVNAQKTINALKYLI